MNPYLKNLNKLEFVVTYACTGRCKHCSQGEHTAGNQGIDPNAAANAVKRVAAAYPIKTVMTFGGEPLLHTEAVCAIMAAATDMGVAKRQVITNGYFSKDAACLETAARRLAAVGVNEVLLSVDAFHQESIPPAPVKVFAAALLKNRVPTKLSPAWLVSPDDDNPYNQRTRELLADFNSMGIPTGAGNVVFPEGNAIIYLSKYFTESKPQNPYEEDPYDVRCLSFEPNGNVLGGNIYRSDILDIAAEYKPF